MNPKYKGLLYEPRQTEKAAKMSANRREKHLRTDFNNHPIVNRICVGRVHPVVDGSCLGVRDEEGNFFSVEEITGGLIDDIDEIKKRKRELAEQKRKFEYTTLDHKLTSGLRVIAMKDLSTGKKHLD